MCYNSRVVLPPLSTCLISAGLVLCAILIVDKARARGMFRRPAAITLAVCAALLFGTGLALHLSTPPPAGIIETTRQVARTEPVKWSFAFEPKGVRWGEEVRLRVTPETDDFTVYFNGRPLPKKTVGRGSAAVTIPANSKSGYFTLDFDGTRVEAGEQLTVTME